MSSESEDDVQSLPDVELEALRSIYLNDLEVMYDEGIFTVEKLYSISAYWTSALNLFSHLSNYSEDFAWVFAGSLTVDAHAIFGGDRILGKIRCPVITIQLYPSTADNVDEQYVRMSLILYLPTEYPSVIPDIQIKNSRGLSDEKLQRITDDLFSKAEERKGTTMLFELIECAKDHLTAGNRPSCQCAICLYGFTEQDVFTKTKCYHYFHSHCLSRYITHQLREIETAQQVENSGGGESRSEVWCPVCRISISCFIPDDSDFPPPTSAVDDSFTVTEELKQLQNKMADLYNRQKDKGGIIDIEAEKNKFLLEISSVSSEAQPVSEAEQPDSVQNCTPEDMQCDFGQQRKENLILSKNKSCNQTQNSISQSKQGSSWYQKCNRRIKDSNYISDKNSGTKHDKCQEIRKSYTHHDEEHSKWSLIQGGENENYVYAKPTSLAGDELKKSKVQKNDGTQKVAYVPFGSCNDYELSPIDSFSSDATDQSKCNHSDRTQRRPGYHKRYQNCNHRSNFYEGKHFSVTHGTSFGRDISLCSRRSGNNHQHPRNENNCHQMRTSGSYNKKIQSEENCLKQCVRSSDHDGNKQPDEFISRPKQNRNYSKSRQDFHRRLRCSSRFEQYDLDQKELLSSDTKRTDCTDLKHQSTQGGSPVKNNQNSLDQITVSESLRQHSKIYGRVNRRNCCSSRRTNKLQHGHRRYENKYEDRPRNNTSSYMEHQSPSHLVQENSASRNLGVSISTETCVSPDRYPKHPFRRQDGKIPEEAHRSSFSPVRRQNSLSKVHKIHDVCTPVFDSSNNSDENYSPVIDWFSVNEVERRNSLAVRKADTNYSVSRPPPGFAKKVVYGLPSVKPPPGFSQS